MQRNPEQRFMGGAWVFPGGAVHATTPTTPPPRCASSRRRPAIGAAEPAPSSCRWSRWITPAEVMVRFDTWFFVAEAPPGAEATVDGGECVDARWLRPAAALEAHERDELMLVFPTIKHLEALGEIGSVARRARQARAREVVPVQPRVVVRDGTAEVLLPGEPGYDEA